MILLIGQAIEWMTEQGERFQSILYSAAHNLYIRCLPGKAIYIARDQEQAEIGLFGGVGDGTGQKELYIDSTDASDSVPLPLSPVVRLRASWYNEGQTGIFSFKSQVTPISPTQAKLVLSFGKSGKEIPFYTVVYQNNQVSIG